MPRANAASTPPWRCISAANTNNRQGKVMTRNKYLFAAWMLGALCTATLPRVALAQQEHLGRSQSPLVSVTVVTAAQQEQLGLLSMVSNRGGCTASLLDNNWAVSASHCLNANDMRNPAGVMLSAAWSRAQFARPDYIYRFWGIDVQGSTYDISLLHL